MLKTVTINTKNCISAIHQQVAENEETGLPSFTVLHSEEFVIIQSPVHQSQQDQEEHYAILKNLQEEGDNPENYEGDTDGELVAQGPQKGKLPLKRSSRIQRKKGLD